MISRDASGLSQLLVSVPGQLDDTPHNFASFSISHTVKGKFHDKTGGGDILHSRGQVQDSLYYAVFLLRVITHSLGLTFLCSSLVALYQNN
ncbi:uncharacterized protein BDV17DRAFT_143516 [Aspergillus undulatus]|uniref:uncharacterized protein n=1 Tax=Aspergillus undulatus TaxID=1810928 RepID=UPI003CCCC3D5